MELPKTYKELLEQKEAFILDSTQKLNETIKNYQNALFMQIIGIVLKELDIDNEGNIKNTLKNYRVISELNTITENFAIANKDKITSTILTTATKIGAFNYKYFTIAVSDTTQKRLEYVKQRTDEKMFARLGYINGRLLSGGFLENFTTPAGIIDTIAQTTTNSVTAQTGIRDLIKTLEIQITGGEQMGLLERRLKGFAHDVFTQYDRAYSWNMAKEFKMEYFVYSGGLVKDSRDFCTEMEGRVFHISEAKSWKKWTPAKKTRPFVVKQKCVTCVPSYINYAGYEPLIDLGGYNCRHNIAYISKEMAFKLRPELKTMVFKE